MGRGLSRRRCAAVAAVLIAAGAAAVSVAGCGGPAVTAGGRVDEFTTHLDRRIPELMERYGVPGVAAALISEGEVAWTNAYGLAVVAEERPMTVNTVGRAESISKSVTAWGVMRLVERGIVELDDPLLRHVDGWQFSGAARGQAGEVTIARLLNNSAGLPLGPIGPATEYEPGSRLPDKREYLADLARIVQEPGGSFIYSNVGFNHLDILVEETTGRAFAGYMAEEVLEPLGMGGSSYAWRDSFADSFANGYENDGTPVPPYVYPVNGAGGLMATVEDLARFVAASVAGPRREAQEVLSLESIRTMHRGRISIPGMYGFVADAYGFGHFVEELPDGRTAVWHGGQGHGWMTHFHAVPESGHGIVIVTNSQRSWPFLAHVLSDWAAWSGIGSVKFGRIARLNTALQVVTVVVALIALVQAYRLVRALRRGNRRVAPLSRHGRVGRASQGTGGLVLIAVLIRRATLPYLFETAIFPTVYGWTALALLVLAVVLLVSALMPKSP
ncbi:MAG: serine hydrolase domain-containing protein [bacterium]